MNPDVKAKWVAWLRDPENVQGQGQLRIRESDGPAHCCLGGLCEVYRDEVGGYWDSTVFPFVTGDAFVDVTGEGRDTMLTGGVIEWAGLTSAVAQFAPRRVNGDEIYAENLVTLNDTANWSFAEIADFIEENF